MSVEKDLIKSTRAVCQDDATVPRGLVLALADALEAVQQRVTELETAGREALASLLVNVRFTDTADPSDAEVIAKTRAFVAVIEAEAIAAANRERDAARADLARLRAGLERLAAALDGECEQLMEGITVAGSARANIAKALRALLQGAPSCAMSEPAPKVLTCSNCGDRFDDPPRDCQKPTPGRPLVECGRGGHMFDHMRPLDPGEAPFDEQAARDAALASVVRPEPSP